ncbi:MAG: T9SS type A sorting domain-containing protein, partial [Flavobacteriales bacterium]
IIIISGLDLVATAGWQEYQWFYYNDPTGPDTQIWEPSNVGEYTVQVTNEHGCSTMSAPVFWTGVGVEEQENEWNIYPNPSAGLVYIQSHSTIGRVEVIDTTGRVIMTEWIFGNTGTLDLSRLAAGMYSVNGIPVIKTK